MIQRSLVILKPDAVQRGLMGRILSRFEDKGLKVVAARFCQLSRSTVENQYAVHRGKPFYDGLVRFMTQAPCLLLCLEGPAAIDVCRGMMGSTFGTESAPGTIRGDYGSSRGLNLIHGSDSAEAADREIALYFNKEDLVSYEPRIQPWVYNEEDRS